MNRSKPIFKKTKKVTAGTTAINAALTGKGNATNKYKFTRKFKKKKSGTIIAQNTPEALSSRLTPGTFRINL
ncbi:hypothetical protein KAS06_01295 [Candidatus Bathyarchaeota archaeon]|nr:hypothetical protein [Candidatus Bathyarchaeota archaeon]